MPIVGRPVPGIGNNIRITTSAIPSPGIPVRITPII
jgi:hypothetical protein